MLATADSQKSCRNVDYQTNDRVSKTKGADDNICVFILKVKYHSLIVVGISCSDAVDIVEEHHRRESVKQKEKVLQV